MKIILDAMSGDNAPDEIIKGAADAVKEYGVKILLTGKKEVIEERMSALSISGEGIEIYDAREVVTMEDDYLVVIKSKKDSSMSRGLELLKKGEGDAFISAGNTGALTAGATLILRRIKGIKSASIGTILPLGCPMLLIDSGANVSPTSENLRQFAIMGSIYMKNLFGIENPRVGLVNNGAEQTKGTEVHRKAYELLRDTPDINFIGNIEGRELVEGVCDVAVCDGFTGNVVLKMTEGFGKFMSRTLKGIMLANPLTKLGSLTMLGKVKALKKQLDYTEYGGAPLIGVSAPVIKAHGSSNAKAIKSAVGQAITFAKTGVVQEITAAAQAIRESNIGAKEE